MILIKKYFFCNINNRFISDKMEKEDDLKKENERDAL
jgi:hypothetical protein